MKNIFKAGILTVFCVLFMQPAFCHRSFES